MSATDPSYVTHFSFGNAALCQSDVVLFSVTTLRCLFSPCLFWISDSCNNQQTGQRSSAYHSYSFSVPRAPKYQSPHCVELKARANRPDDQYNFTGGETVQL